MARPRIHPLPDPDDDDQAAASAEYVRPVSTRPWRSYQPPPISHSGPPPELVGDFAAPPAPAVYRTVIAARGIGQANALLAAGWELISAEFCEEIIARSAGSRLPRAAVWRPYLLLGKRDPLMPQTRARLPS